MKHLDTGSDKIKKICDAIRHETIEPAKQQAKMILEQASDQAASIIQEARDQAESMLQHAKKQHEKEKQIFESSMAHSAKLFKEQLRLDIEQHFLSETLSDVSNQVFKSTELAAKIVNALVHGLSQKSLSGDLVLILSKTMDKQDVVKHLAKDVSSRMADIKNSEEISGIVLKSQKDGLRIEISQDQLTSALMESIRADFRKYFYQGS